MLKIGLMLNKDQLVPAWAHEVLTEIEKTCKFHIAIINASTPTKKKDPILYQLFRRIEKRISKPKEDALALVKFEPECYHCPVWPVYEKHKDIFTAADVAFIKKLDLDVILRFGFRILSGDILNAAKYGIWSYHHGDYRHYRGMPAGFWEVVNSDPKTGAMLQTLTEDLDQGKVIRSATYHAHNASPRKNASNVAWQAAHFLTEELRVLDETKSARFEDKLQCVSKLYKTPTNQEMLSIFPMILIKKAKSFKKKPWQWQIAYGQGLDFKNFKVAVPLKNFFWADPFVVSHEGRHFVFYEELERGKKAHISCAVIENGVWKELGRVLDFGIHLSYPFVFKREGTYFMIPESMEVGKINLYYAKDFPLKWGWERTLVHDVYAADPTLLIHENELYLFATLGRKNLTNNSELYLWHSKGLAHEWKLHRNSPVQNDVSLARPAGSIYSTDGNLYRPSQDSINLKVNLNRIDQLDTLNYKEKKIGEIKPWDNFAGLHTFNFDGNLTVVDVLSRK